MEHNDSERLLNLFCRCLGRTAVDFCPTANIVNGLEREIWDCTYVADEAKVDAILIVFKPGDNEHVNTNLPPVQAAEKCALAMKELPVHGIPAPELRGYTLEGEQTALLCEKIRRLAWNPDCRIAAARILARLHLLPVSRLSSELQELIWISSPRLSRFTDKQSSFPEPTTLVHGDYFSVNLLPTEKGLCVIDWETLGLGGPMWDLGFLVGADRDIPEDEIQSTISEYGKRAPVDQELLSWIRNRWNDFWKRHGK